ncbi:MAG: NAD(P)-binding domain-containing protein, partial [Desulfobacterales bacterium]|nr:NAD(P)-binding domain-containing protein [Desulfobacterales bacterium]
MNKVAVVAGGSWGTALANQLAIKGYNPVKLLVIDEKWLVEINTQHTNEDFLPGVVLEKAVVATMEWEEISSADVIVLSVPSHVLREAVRKIKEQLGEKRPIFVSTVKGIEEETHLRMSEVILAE